jgi:hypothetical protein
VTRTYAVLEISGAAYAEIRDKLQAAGYSDQFCKDDGAEVIDMHGIAVKSDGGAYVTFSKKVDKARSAF